MHRFFAALALLFTLAACGDFKDLKEPPVPMGDFLLGHNIVVAPEPTVGPLSRPATEEEWQESITEAIDERFGRYDGDKYYHIAVKVEGFVLALPGVPLVANPKSVLIAGVTIWDDAQERKINEEPKRFTVFERASPETFLSSGLTQNRHAQRRNLARNLAKKIHTWLLKHPEWFGGEPIEGVVEEEEEEIDLSTVNVPVDPETGETVAVPTQDGTEG